MKLNKNVPAVAIALSLSLLASGVAEAQPANYSFEKLADTNGSFSSFGAPVINNVGEVAFTANQDEGGVGLFSTSDGTTVTTIADKNRVQSIGDVSINDSGTVAFIAIPADSDAAQFRERLYTSDGTTITPITFLPEGFAAPCCSVAINNAGVVAYVAQNPRNSAVVTSDGRTIATSGDTRFGSIDSVDINDKGTVVYREASTYDFAIFANNGTTNTRIFETSFYPRIVNRDPGVNSPVVNNQGTVAFVNIPELDSAGNLDLYKAAILKSDGTTTTTIADRSQTFYGVGNLISNTNGVVSFIPPSINDHGTVAFVGVLYTGPKGIFTGSDPVKDKVIATGDTLFGYKVEDVNLSEEGLNNAGQITFTAKLDNGTEVVVRANPQD